MYYGWKGSQVLVTGVLVWWNWSRGESESKSERKARHCPLQRQKSSNPSLAYSDHLSRFGVTMGPVCIATVGPLGSSDKCLAVLVDPREHSVKFQMFQVLKYKCKLTGKFRKAKSYQLQWSERPCDVITEKNKSQKWKMGYSENKNMGINAQVQANTTWVSESFPKASRRQRTA